MASPIDRTQRDDEAGLLLTLASHEKQAELVFRVSGEDERDPQWGGHLLALGRQYALFAQSLRLIAAHRGGSPSTPDVPRKGASWLFDSLVESRESALLRACEASECATIDAYRAARKYDWPDFVDAALARHARVHTTTRFGLLARRRHGNAVLLKA